MRKLVVYIAGLGILLGLSACQSTGEVKQRSEPSSPAYTSESPARVYIDLSSAYAAAGQLAFAMQNAQKAVEVDPKNPHAHAVLANAHQLAGNHADAGRHFAEARALSPSDPYVAILYGQHLCSQGQTAAADAEFLSAATNPRNAQPWNAYANAGICYEKAGQYKSARNRLNSAYEINKVSPQTIQALARVERKLGNRTRARQLESQLR